MINNVLYATVAQRLCHNIIIKTTSPFLLDVLLSSHAELLYVAAAQPP